MIQDVKLGTHYMYAMSKCAFLLGFRLEIMFFFKMKIIEKSNKKCGCGKWCDHKKGSNSVAYDDSYCDKFEGFTR